jgi:class 3 adenylate cyclase
MAMKKRKPEDAYYNGINAATLSLLIGHEKQSRDIAVKVKTICLIRISALNKTSRGISCWLYATLGEAELLLGNIDQAISWYTRAGNSAGRNLRDISSMRTQASMILKHIKQASDIISECFHIPSITVFSGHRLDSSGRNQNKFPLELEKAVQDQIAKKLDTLDTGIAYSSAACGSDIIFLEQVLKRGGEINIALPFEKEHFIRESVNISSKGNWVKRFERLLNKAKTVKVLGFYDPLAIRSNLDFCNLFMHGTACLHSQLIGTKLTALTVWDGKPGLPGGTASAVQHWKSVGQQFLQIDPATMLPQKKAGRRKACTTKKIKKPLSGVKHYTYLPLLFADVKGYSKLSEDQLVKFSIHYMKAIGRLTNRHASGLLSTKTQGDGLFFVFKDLTTAVTLATDLRNTISRIDWNRYGLPSGLTARISLDAGPCYSYHDPVADRMDFCGTYVNRAARLEPITPPGQIYASETFVALCQTEGIQNTRFNYAGQVVLPKNHGIIPAYHVDMKN